MVSIDSDTFQLLVEAVIGLMTTISAYLMVKVHASTAASAANTSAIAQTNAAMVAPTAITAAKVAETPTAQEIAGSLSNFSKIDTSYRERLNLPIPTQKTVDECNNAYEIVNYIDYHSPGGYIDVQVLRAAIKQTMPREVCERHLAPGWVL